MLVCILWPYGRADNSPGTSQREDRLVADRPLGRFTYGTTLGNHNSQHEQSKECPGQAGSSQAGCHYVWSGNRQSNHVLRTEPRHILRKKRRQNHYQLQPDDLAHRQNEVFYQHPSDEQQGHQGQFRLAERHYRLQGPERSNELVQLSEAAQQELYQCQGILLNVGGDVWIYWHSGKRFPGTERSSFMGTGR